MKTCLRVYGESYVASWKTEPQNQNWTHKLADRLGIHEKNFAVSGSSSSYSIKKLYDDLKNNHIEEDSIIIILLTTHGRFYNTTILEKFPMAGTLFLHGKFNYSTEHEMVKYYNKHRDSINWWLTENSSILESINIQSFVYWLKNHASVKFPQHKFVVMFNSVYKDYDFSNLVRSDNFLLLDNFSINQVSNNEIDLEPTPNIYFEFTKKQIMLILE